MEHEKILCIITTHPFGLIIRFKQKVAPFNFLVTVSFSQSLYIAWQLPTKIRNGHPNLFICPTHACQLLYPFAPRLVLRRGNLKVNKGDLPYVNGLFPYGETIVIIGTLCYNISSLFFPQKLGSLITHLFKFSETTSRFRQTIIPTLNS